jgi:hypothetical protein
LFFQGRDEGRACSAAKQTNSPANRAVQIQSSRD